MKKVRISYTADFTEVPVEISNILQKSVNINEEVSVFIKSAQRKALNEEVDSSFNDVKSARENLLRSVVVLEDAMDILQGYNRTVQQFLREEAGKIEIGETGPPVDDLPESGEEEIGE